MNFKQKFNMLITIFIMVALTACMSTNKNTDEDAFGQSARNLLSQQKRYPNSKIPSADSTDISGAEAKLILERYNNKAKHYPAVHAVTERGKQD